MTSTFQKLRFKVYDLPPEQDVIEQFPELTRYPVFTGSTNKYKNLLLRYMIFMYDPETDLNHEVPELAKRKVRAAELAGFSKEMDVTGIFNLTDKEALDFLLCFIQQVYHNRDHTEWVTLSQEYDVITRLRMTPSKKKVTSTTARDIESTNKLRNQAHAVMERIETLEKKMFGDNVDVKDILTQSRYLSPEHFAGLVEAKT